MAVFEAAETLGLVADGRRLAGERIPRCNDSLTTRPLTEEEAKRVRGFADRGQLFSRRAVIVALAFAGGTSSEIAKVRKSHVDLKTATVTVGGRQNRLCEWGQQMIRQFLRIRPLIDENRLLAVSEQIEADRRGHAVTVRLGEVISRCRAEGNPRRVGPVCSPVHRPGDPRGGGVGSRRLVPRFRLADQRREGIGLRLETRRTPTVESVHGGAEVGKKKGARPRVFNDDLDSVPVEQIDLAWEDDTYLKREDEPLVLKRLTAASSKSDRNVKGEPLGWGDDERLSSLVAFSLLWEIGALVENKIRSAAGNHPKGGRPRLHTAAEMLLFEKATFIYGSNRGTDRNLNTINKNWSFPTEQHKWEMLKRAVEKAWPNHPERRLSDTPVTRDNHYYFRKTYLKGMSMLEYLAKEITGLGLEAAEFIGLLNPEAGSISRPDPTQVVPGDGTWTRSAYKNPPPGQPGHDPNHRCDPHARPSARPRKRPRLLHGSRRRTGTPPARTNPPLHRPPHNPDKPTPTCSPKN